MKMMMAALDLGAASNAVMARAVQLATENAAWLVLLHVIEADSLYQGAGKSNEIDNNLWDELKQHTVIKLEMLLADCERSRRTSVRVEFGSPHEVITRLAAELSVDVVVIGAGETEGLPLSERILGSTADRVVRTSRAPVLVIKNETVEPYRRVTVAVDFSRQSASAVKIARKLAPLAKLELVHVTDFPFTFEQALLGAKTPHAIVEDYHAATIDTARRDLAEFARKEIGTDKAATRHLQGTPGPVLVRLLQDEPIDLLALGPHGRGIVMQAILGSVTQRVLREAVCDVLVANSW